MLATLAVIFLIAYTAIVFEHPLKINKAASALVGAGLLWTIYALACEDHLLLSQQLAKTLSDTAQIIFFLMGAMTIVELIDEHNGFIVITERIRTSSQSKLLWLVGIVTFFLSAMLDNLTTTIVMISLMKKLLDNTRDRLFFAGIIVVAANAGGAWSPIGDVTTTMLWIGGQVTALNIVQQVFLASLANLLVPLAVTAYLLRGKTLPALPPADRSRETRADRVTRRLIFTLGIGVLVMIPVFKTVTHLPPFMGMLFGLGGLWLVSELLLRNRSPQERENLTLSHALSRIDMSSVIFFIGILLAIATLEHSELLAGIAGWLDKTVGRQELIVSFIGVISSIVDNVPLVAASMGMYDLAQYPPDSFLWEFMAYCAGTGGSILIIGSAAGIAAMGLEKIHFFWYVKKISGLALLGYLSGVGVFILQSRLLHG
ncbi:MAG: sodium:proton antiporter [Desulfuromonas sp.]|nr:MAG: sodium:proton antiporter [Desulfuromonas sp.]